MTRVTLGATQFEPVEIDLWGSEFVTVPVTRKVERRVQELDIQVREVEDTDRAVELLADIIDAQLSPKVGKQKASVLIVRKWKADELSLGDLQRFCEELGAAGRPT